ncbi:MAG: hypothetical protein H6584_00095 [Flavobacteriales bacterium]|nr:hypothetical protein [Flavobacteriales bacterium]
MRLNNSILILILNFVFYFGCAQKSTIDYLGIGDSTKFSSQHYYLNQSFRPYKNYFIQEYLKLNQNIHNFNKSIVIVGIIDSTSIDQLASLKLDELKQMKIKNKTVNFQIMFKDDGGRMIEFSYFDGTYHFWNIQRYTVQTLKNGRQVGVMYTYVEREIISNQRSIKDIQESIEEKRVSYINEVGEMDLPSVSIE